MAKGSHYDKAAADFAVRFVESLKHTKGRWHGVDFKLIGWQEEIIRDLFGILKKNGYRQFNMAYIEIPKKQGNACAFPIDENALRGRVCCGGLDLSSTTDITAFVLVFPPRTEEESTSSCLISGCRRTTSGSA